MKPPFFVMGVDPGLTGAFAMVIRHADKSFELTGIWDMPTKAEGRQKLQVDATRFAKIIDKPFLTLVVLERVQSSPQQGVASAFRFGKGAGLLEGVLTGLTKPYVLIPPATWKWKMGLRGADKKASLEMARGLWANQDWFRRAKDDGRAEAALLGLHWLREHGGKQC